MEGNFAITAEQLEQYIKRIERLEEEKATLASDVKEVYAEAKSNGFDVMTIKQIVKLRRMDTEKRAEQQAILDTYMTALGMTF